MPLYTVVCFPGIEEYWRVCVYACLWIWRKWRAKSTVREVDGSGKRCVNDGVPAWWMGEREGWERFVYFVNARVYFCV